MFKMSSFARTQVLKGWRHWATALSIILWSRSARTRLHSSHIKASEQSRFESSRL